MVPPSEVEVHGSGAMSGAILQLNESGGRRRA
jgi:hypothetical protein